MQEAIDRALASRAEAEASIASAIATALSPVRVEFEQLGLEFRDLRHQLALLIRPEIANALVAIAQRELSREALERDERVKERAVERRRRRWTFIFATLGTIFALATTCTAVFTAYLAFSGVAHPLLGR